MNEIIKSFPQYYGTNLYPFMIEMAGVSYCDGQYCIAREHSHVNVMEYIKSGNGTVTCNGVTYIAKQGDVILLPEGSNHIYRSDSDDPWVKIWINFYGPIAHPLILAYDLSNQIVFHDCDEKTARLFDQIIDFANRGEDIEETFSECSICFHQILSDLHQKHPEKTIGMDLEILKIKNYISAKAEQGVTMNQVCDAFYLSRSCIFRRFKEMYGMSPTDFYQKERLSVAKQFLEHSFMSIKEISDRMNFADQHYFCIWFKSKKRISLENSIEDGETVK